MFLEGFGLSIFPEVVNVNKKVKYQEFLTDNIVIGQSLYMESFNQSKSNSKSFLLSYIACKMNPDI